MKQSDEIVKVENMITKLMLSGKFKNVKKEKIGIGAWKLIEGETS